MVTLQTLQTDCRQKSALLPNQSVTHMMQEMRDLAATSSEDRNPSISPHNFPEA